LIDILQPELPSSSCFNTYSNRPRLPQNNQFIQSHTYQSSVIFCIDSYQPGLSMVLSVITELDIPLDYAIVNITCVSIRPIQYIREFFDVQPPNHSYRIFLKKSRNRCGILQRAFWLVFQPDARDGLRDVRS